MPKEKRNVRLIVINLVRALLLFAMIGAFIGGRRLVLLIALLALLVTFLPYVLRKGLGIEVPANFEVIIILFIYGLLLFGEMKGFYSEFWWMDIFLRLASSVALGLVGLTVLYTLYRDEKVSASPMIIAVFSFCFAVAVGALWEVFEFSVDYLFGFNLQKEGLEGAMRDMIFVSIGALFVSGLGYNYIKKGKVVLISSLIEKFVEKNPKLFGSVVDRESQEERIKKVIQKGEHKKMEFKSTFRTNLYTNQQDKMMEKSVLKTIAAYLNSDGGTLFIGVGNNGEIIGLEKDGFDNKDRAHLHLTTLVRDFIGGEHLPFIKSETIEIEGKNIIKIECNKSSKPVFLKNGKDEEFYVRNGPATTELRGSSLVDYINHNFGEKS